MPAGGDAYIMKHIIHDWDDERAGADSAQHPARACRRTDASSSSRRSSQPGNQPDLAKFIDVEMLLMTGGRERSAEEFRALFDANGFTHAHRAHGCAALVVEARIRTRVTCTAEAVAPGAESN